MTTSSGDRHARMPLSAFPLHPGTARGRVLRLDEPLSFWGGTDTAGRIIDRHHPQSGESVTGRVLVMLSGRGSSSSSSVLAEQLRRGTGPAAIVLGEPDAIVTLGAIVAAELYGVAVPVALLGIQDLDTLGTGDEVVVECTQAAGRVTPVV